MGEWGWVLGVNTDALSPEEVKKRMAGIQLDDTETRFLNDASLQAMLAFGRAPLIKLIRLK